MAYAGTVTNASPQLVYSPIAYLIGTQLTVQATKTGTQSSFRIMRIDWLTKQLQKGEINH
ncbi:hypothetical protein DFE_2823 [Desulfovibrio ferrophilus]|uniref:Uncharacterized protein n=1 Tax=Desulfovibrio ferrophilus TaxID=241368 RepID=A0A2Z6B206_9BACT|nr:hypothetical protein DFE_2823 [Desulfovibrio ferrophilus]